MSEYEESGCDFTTDRLMRLFDEERRFRWQSAMDKLNFTHAYCQTGISVSINGCINPLRNDLPKTCPNLPFSSMFTQRMSRKKTSRKFFYADDVELSGKEKIV
jgi:hypothetical protein